MKIALLSSRAPRAVPLSAWLWPTFVLARRFASRGECLVSSLGTLPYDAVSRAVTTEGGPLLLLLPEKQPSTLTQVLGDTSRPGLAVKVLTSSVPAARDQAVVAEADLAIAVSVRAGGNMERLLRARHCEGREVRALEAIPGQVLPEGNRRLLEAGVPPLRECLPPAPHDPDATVSAFPFQAWLEAPLEGMTLAHFTRACPGAWPGQSQGEYLDDLERGGHDADRSALASLSRICLEMRLRGSRRLIRGGYSVVSLTALTPERASELHRYQKHLKRWDFEPLGLVFDAQVLSALGARAVRYLPSSQFTQLSESERPFFQKHEPPECDYHEELEWRIPGDLLLANLPASAVRVFVGGSALERSRETEG